jgi:site-specific recombinase XerD
MLDLKTISNDMIAEFLLHLEESGYSKGTVTSYRLAVKAFSEYLGSNPLTVESVAAFRSKLVSEVPSVKVNNYAAGINKYFEFLQHPGLRVQYCPASMIQEDSPENELPLNDLRRLIDAARNNGKPRTELLLRTMFATGIRVSEVKYITVEAVRQGKAVIPGKHNLNSETTVREITIPKKLCNLLNSYCDENGILRGAVFAGRKRTGTSISRQHIFREIKFVAELAGIDGNANPMLVRKLFGRTYYSAFGNAAETVDALGNKHIGTIVRYLNTTQRTEYKQHMNTLYEVTMNPE